jgi:hypothetical protein
MLENDNPLLMSTGRKHHHKDFPRYYNIDLAMKRVYETLIS